MKVSFHSSEIDSLNLSVASSIGMWEYGRRSKRICVKFAHTEKNHFLKIMSSEL